MSAERADSVPVDVGRDMVASVVDLIERERRAVRAEALRLYEELVQAVMVDDEKCLGWVEPDDSCACPLHTKIDDALQRLRR